MGAPVAASEVTVAAEIEAIAESLGELVIAEDPMVSVNRRGEASRPGRVALS